MSNGINDLLDATLDDLEDLPSFEPFPPGVHRVYASLDFKEINEKQCVELELKGIETEELSNPTTDEPIKEGDIATALFMLDNEFGRGNLKKVATPLAMALGTSSIRECVEQAKDVECLVLTSIRKDKNDPDRKYMSVKELTVI